MLLKDGISKITSKIKTNIGKVDLALLMNPSKKSFHSDILVKSYVNSSKLQLGPNKLCNLFRPFWEFQRDFERVQVINML